MAAPADDAPLTVGGSGVAVAAGGHGGGGADPPAPTPAPPRPPPSGPSRYIRVGDAELEGSNRHKRIYKAYDVEEGIELAMHQVELRGERVSSVDLAALKSSALDHPDLIKVTDAWIENNTLVIVTPMLNAGTLQNYVARIDDVRFRVLRKWCRQVLSGLGHIHSLGRAHGDVRLSNIFINGTTGNVLLGYFAVGTAIDVTVDGDAFERTIRYLPPEVSSAHLHTTGTTGDGDTVAITPEGDMYAFGMCLLEMVTGTMPYASFGGDWKRVEEAKKAGERPPELADVMLRAATDEEGADGGIGDGDGIKWSLMEVRCVRDAIDRCLEVDPLDRPTVADLMESDFLRDTHAEREKRKRDEAERRDRLAAAAAAPGGSTMSASQSTPALMNTTVGTGPSLLTPTSGAGVEAGGATTWASVPAAAPTTTGAGVAGSHAYSMSAMPMLVNPPASAPMPAEAPMPVDGAAWAGGSPEAGGHPTPAGSQAGVAVVPPPARTSAPPAAATTPSHRDGAAVHATSSGGPVQPAAIPSAAPAPSSGVDARGDRDRYIKEPTSLLGVAISNIRFYSTDWSVLLNLYQVDPEDRRCVRVRPVKFKVSHAEAAHPQAAIRTLAYSMLSANLVRASDGDRAIEHLTVALLPLLYFPNISDGTSLEPSHAGGGGVQPVHMATGGPVSWLAGSGSGAPPASKVVDVPVGRGSGYEDKGVAAPSLGMAQGMLTGGGTARSAEESGAGSSALRITKRVNGSGDGRGPPTGPPSRSTIVGGWSGGDGEVSGEDGGGGGGEGEVAAMAGGVHPGGHGYYAGGGGGGGHGDLHASGGFDGGGGHGAYPPIHPTHHGTSVPAGSGGGYMTSIYRTAGGRPGPGYGGGVEVGGYGGGAVNMGPSHADGAMEEDPRSTDVTEGPAHHGAHGGGRRVMGVPHTQQPNPGMTTTGTPVLRVHVVGSPSMSIVPGMPSGAPYAPGVGGEHGTGLMPGSHGHSDGAGGVMYGDAGGMHGGVSSGEWAAPGGGTPHPSVGGGMGIGTIAWDGSGTTSPGKGGPRPQPTPSAATATAGGMGSMYPQGSGHSVNHITGSLLHRARAGTAASATSNATFEPSPSHAYTPSSAFPVGGGGPPSSAGFGPYDGSGDGLAAGTAFPGNPAPRPLSTYHPTGTASGTFTPAPSGSSGGVGVGGSGGSRALPTAWMHPTAAPASSSTGQPQPSPLAAGGNGGGGGGGPMASLPPPTAPGAMMAGGVAPRGNTAYTTARTMSTALQPLAEEEGPGGDGGGAMGGLGAGASA